MDSLQTPAASYLLCPPDTPPFPVNPRAIHHLVQQKYISMPTITQAEIEDRSKADILVKTVACVQGGYMIAQCIARPRSESRSQLLGALHRSFCCMHSSHLPDVAT